MELQLLPLWYSVGVPAVALAICVACRWHRVLLWLGGGLLVLTIGGIVLAMLLPRSEHPTAETMQLHVLLILGVTVLTLPLLAAGLILLIGGLVRWGLARWRGRPTRASDPPEAKGDPESGSPPDG
jgi:hypothetical protein